MCGWHEIESNFFEEVGYGQEMRWQFWKFLLHVLVAIKGKEIKEMMISTSIPYLLMIIFLWRYLRGNSDFLFQIYMLTGHMRIKKQRRNFSYLLLIFFFLVIKPKRKFQITLAQHLSLVEMHFMHKKFITSFTHFTWSLFREPF